MLKNQRSERHQPLFRLDRPDRCSGFGSRKKRSSPNQLSDAKVTSVELREVRIDRITTVQTAPDAKLIEIRTMYMGFIDSQLIRAKER